MLVVVAIMGEPAGVSSRDCVRRGGIVSQICFQPAYKGRFGP